jgi:hypothetical protein
MDRATRWIVRFRKYIRCVGISSGLLLIAVGGLILTDRMNQIAIWGLLTSVA